ncbi:type IV secretory system conjugative DNA transfer family protein [Rhodoplanes sp. Z2-YC6860]|uniref:type IV secretory system conjugative DNA transfer family protein n=1 Tax=Rhodoplanes sp. Z2-YC6860 TaxID=674703 RepID=UPI00078C7E72|nr:type IV secretory system conjugative DNA transfer family protein [Rhodoplanes sp. Z2-YC6860]AMN40491.1 conjugal transfer protein TraG [Rhodoplanes sp. Z2-YC6860]
MTAAFPPRGYGDERIREGLPKRLWTHPWQLDSSWKWRPGKIVLGKWEAQEFGDPDREAFDTGSGDDRHIVTVAGTRAGKSSTVLVPNLLRYPGSAVILDPKGELARKTARHRAETLGHAVAVLDPFGTSGWKSTSYNPLDDLDPHSETYVDDIGLVVDSIIIPGKTDPHWPDSAKNLITGLALYMTCAGGKRTMPRLRRLLLGKEGKLANADPKDAAEDNLFVRMAAMDGFDDLIAMTGRNFLDKQSKELDSIISTAREQTRFLDSRSLTSTLASSPLRLSDLKRKPVTIYLCLPATRLATHSRWLRMVLQLAFVQLEKDRAVPRFPVLFLLEEFNALGYLQSIENAAGFMAGFGVRLWSVLQDFTQLKTHYPNSWETFIGNAGVLQAFGNVDVTTTAHLSKMIGNTRVTESNDVFVSGSAQGHGDSGRRDQNVTTPLIEPTEIAHYFARQTNRQMLLVPGKSPVYMERLDRPEEA